ncbi:hypothetical protein KJ840_03095 [Patescibacteria group bacterium]|nr:hypothetical protein [Patescibacteria group bacterium]
MKRKEGRAEKETIALEAHDLIGAFLRWLIEQRKRPEIIINDEFAGRLRLKFCTINWDGTIEVAVTDNSDTLVWYHHQQATEIHSITVHMMPPKGCPSKTEREQYKAAKSDGDNVRQLFGKEFVQHIKTCPYCQAFIMS